MWAPSWSRVGWCLGHAWVTRDGHVGATVHTLRSRVGHVWVTMGWRMGHVTVALGSRVGHVCRCAGRRATRSARGKC
eukprot:1215870-Rhodomonas_salina.1